MHNYSCLKSSSGSHITLTKQLKTLRVLWSMDHRVHQLHAFASLFLVHADLLSLENIISVSYLLGRPGFHKRFCLLPILQLSFFRPPDRNLLQDYTDWYIVFFINKTKCIVPYFSLNSPSFFFFFLKMLVFKYCILIFCL